MEYIHGTLIYLASQPQRPQQVRTAIANWVARNQQFDIGAPEVLTIPPGHDGQANPQMVVHLWFGNDPVADRAESLNAWNTIQGLSLTWVQPGSKIVRGTDAIDPPGDILNTRTF